MGFKFYNANPEHHRIGDCVIRAISALTGKSWDEVYKDLSMEGFRRRDMPNANNVWGAYLRGLGYTREIVPDTCQDCYTVADFAQDHPDGKYLLALNQHVVAVDSGCWLDTWDSGNETVMYFWRKDE